MEGYKYGTAPNAFLQSEAHRIAPRSKVLVPSDGGGRNSVWLARQGHQVTALDASTVSLLLQAAAGITTRLRQNLAATLLRACGHLFVVLCLVGLALFVVFH